MRTYQPEGIRRGYVLLAISLAIPLVMPLIMFDSCNFESDPVTVEGIAPGIDDFAIHVSPTMPIEIQPGQCITFSAQGASSTVFDCSGDFGLAYQFTSESGMIDGLGGFVDPRN